MRGGCFATRLWLLAQLEATHYAYTQWFDQLTEEDEIIFSPFIWQSNEPLSPRGKVVELITQSLRQAQENNRPVELVTNGWDGLTSNSVTYFSLFNPWINLVDMTMHIWVDRADADPALRPTQVRYFHSFRIEQAINCMNGDVDGASEEAIQFVEKLQEIWASKTAISDATMRLRRTTYRRNVAPIDMVLPGQRCHFCPAGFDTEEQRDHHETWFCREAPGPTIDEEHVQLHPCRHCGEQFPSRLATTSPYDAVVRG
ncbi:hypothetical protein BDW74DRAFT_102678 [Aspergillus multicolor]|uniref:uncharacterized protein n=1 Tax=Aspergillus multicolor TaxID=41759 RepID=UPI003CCDC80E